MRPDTATPAHKTDRLAELVCSNTFKSTEVTNAHGLLKAELGLLGSLLLEAAQQTSVPGGTALAVDRDEFSGAVTERISQHPNITIERSEVTSLSSPAIVATGPLTSDTLAGVIQRRLGQDALAFYDSIAPIVSGESLNWEELYRMSRYGKGQGTDYVNSPLDEVQYAALIDALLNADQHVAHEFDEAPYFEGCLPVEEMANRGRDTLRFGPLKPVGLRDPRTGQVPFAVVQLRQEDRAGQMWNLVGFQTRLKIPDQRGVIRLIPGLAEAEFLRFGSIHRNTYLNSPASLTEHLSTEDDRMLLFAGQLVGVEGYTESLATGLLAGLNLARMLGGGDPMVPPPETMLGALVRYVHEADPKHFQPMNANFGLLPPLERRERDKRRRRELLAERAIAAMRTFSKRAVVTSA
jgi:methylenetetrahydrofolate--tRNA-(uracil-5-)-methyltransferase